MEIKRDELKKAVENFSYLVHFDLKSLELDERLVDAIESKRDVEKT